MVASTTADTASIKTHHRHHNHHLRLTSHLLIHRLLIRRLLIRSLTCDRRTPEADRSLPARGQPASAVSRARRPADTPHASPTVDPVRA
jgi:hypothetical protein